MTRLILVLGLVSVAWGNIGDNAPSLPTSYRVAQPRLPAPDATYLNLIWANRAGGAAFIWTDATGWNSATPGSKVKMRHLLMAYLAEKLNSGPNVASFLAKIQAFANLSGVWDLTTGNGYWDPAIALAMALDWINWDLGSSTQASMCASLDTMETGFETNFSNASPYSDQYYITGFKQLLPLMVALATYPNCGGNARKHLNFALDASINIAWPAWKSVICGQPCVASTGDTDIDHGGGWHEAWVDYVAKDEGLSTWYVTETLSWAVASGRDAQISSASPGNMNLFNIDYPWLKNFAYWTMYQVRPDYVIEPIQPSSRPYFNSENFSANGVPNATGAPIELLSGLAAVYNSPTFRGWDRLVNWYGTTPNGYVPSAWPYFTPDSGSFSANSRTTLKPTRYFPGIEMLVFRTGWTEDDTFCTFKSGSNFWSHPVADAGALNCYSRGYLTIRSGDYRPGSASDHFQNYALRAIAQTALLVYDVSDIYPGETLTVNHNDGTQTQVAEPNDGGQRAVGSSISNLGGGTMQGATHSPSDVVQYGRSLEFYHMAKNVAYAQGTNQKYVYIATDMTAAYNNLWSRNANTGNWIYNQANTSNRTFRVQKAVRQVTFVPIGTAALVFIYDQVITTNTGFVKKILWHSINSPVIVGNKYTITRADLVTSKPFTDRWPQQWSSSVGGHLPNGIAGQGITRCPGGCTTASTQYQYAGVLTGWCFTTGGNCTMVTVGGASHEFDITDSNGTVNHNECSSGQCGTGEGLGATPGFIIPEPLSGPHQPGSFRIEETVGASNFSDDFMNVQYVTNTGDTTVVGTPTSTVSGGSRTTTIVLTVGGSPCTITQVNHQNGIGGDITATGAGCPTGI